MKTALTTAIATILFATGVFAQNGTMKFSGLIVDDKNETQFTMVSLYQINEGSGEDRLMVGQEIVQGNEWFDVKLEMGQKYEMNVISNNGEERVIAINTVTPAEVENTRFRQAVRINMTGASLRIDHSFKSDAEYAMAYSTSKNLGEVAFDTKAEAFIYDENAVSNMGLTASR